jgi:hypothetical protein
MRKSIAVITAILLTGICLLSSCSFITGATTDNKPPHPTGKSSPGVAKHIDTSTFEFSERIQMKSISTSSHSMIFTGTSDLPEGTVIRSQLYENDILLSWWPSDREYVINSGYWEIKVLMKDTEPHEDLIPESRYLLLIMVKDDPSIIGCAFWDNIGPPVPE